MEVSTYFDELSDSDIESSDNDSQSSVEFPEYRDLYSDYDEEEEPATLTSAAPSTSVAPFTFAAPSTSAAPSMSAAPSTFAAPSTSAAPSAFAAPFTFAAPSTSAAPSAFAAPSTSAAPFTFAAPSTSAAPSMSAAPSTSAAPSMAYIGPSSFQLSDDELEDEVYVEVLPPEQSLPATFPFNELSGPKHMPPPDSHPVEYFHLFFTFTLLSLMVTETNRYAKQVINGYGGNVPKYLKIWKPVTVKDIKGFLAIIFAMGIDRRPKLADYWSNLPPYVSKWYAEICSRNRFYHLLRFFHLVDNSKLPGPKELGYSPSARYQPLEDHANKVFRHHYTPHREICVDESLVGTKCHNPNIQYLPEKKHHKWGIKLWMLCDSVSHYCLGFFTYKGAKSQAEKHNISKFGLGYTVVRQLVKLGNYDNKGYHVFIDNYFTSVPLVRGLYSRGTYCTGTVRALRKQLPLGFNERFAVGQIKYFRSGPILACGFREHENNPQPVRLLSSHEGARDTKIVKRHGVEKLKPQIVLSYNKFMGGVDTHDMMLYTYLDERRTRKCWRKVAFNIMARMMLNAYILYKEKSGSRMTHQRFIQEVIESLKKESKEESVPICHTPPDPRGPPGLRKLPGRHQFHCVVCSTPNQKRTSTRVCTRCGKGLHVDCLIKHQC
ncbi:piggyBac transposable element-derived protein 4-like [Centruroides sculpturatus]|uniref:piggyBac transposable element-derived protein 4-like n=1 Tax=Centruroides sculpturatus TaxID=218467 RepID=UPI000C6D5B87|nr:piggyBac transposable element-derived protein 4-like [Centruroides sculpturatus]